MATATRIKKLLHESTLQIQAKRKLEEAAPQLLAACQNAARDLEDASFCASYEDKESLILRARHELVAAIAAATA